VLREVALERFCARSLEDLKLVLDDTSRGHHELYLAVYKHMQDRDKELARCFDAPRRSQMLLQLIAIHNCDLLEAQEMARFTAETQKVLKSTRE